MGPLTSSKPHTCGRPILLSASVFGVLALVLVLGQLSESTSASRTTLGATETLASRGRAGRAPTGLGSHVLAPPFFASGGDTFLWTQGPTSARLSRAGMEVSVDQRSSFTWALQGGFGSAPRASLKESYPVRSFLGNDPSRWGEARKGYTTLGFRGSFAGSSIEVESRARGVKYSVVLPAGTASRRADLEYRGATHVRLSDDGKSLTVEAGSTRATESGLSCYQPRGSSRLSVACRYVAPVEAPSGTWTYAVEAVGLDPALPLVVDPNIDWIAYPPGWGINSVSAMVVDGAGASYLVGSALRNSKLDAFVTRIRPDGNTDWTTFYGGSDHDVGYGLAMDKAGNLILTGQTTSTDFPLAQAFDSTVEPATGDGFVAKVDSTGAILWSTLLGGSQGDYATKVMVESSGNVVVAGVTNSLDLPTDGGFRQSSDPGLKGFVARIDPAGPPALLWASFLGATSGDRPNALSEDPQGNVIVTGETSSDGQATPGAFSTVRAGLADVFVAKVEPATPGLLWFTYVGGSQRDQALSVQADPAGKIYVAGTTWSPNWPVKQSFGPRLKGDSDGFLAKLDPSGSSLEWSTYVGGNVGETLSAMALNADGTVCTGGMTLSADFPILDGFDTHFEYNPIDFTSDAFLAVVDAQGQLVWSTFWGGTGSEWFSQLVTDSKRNLYALGFAGGPIVMKLSYPDVTRPDAGVVSDGLGDDIDFQSSTSTVFANWGGFTDPESGVKTFEWAVGSSPGKDDLRAFADAGFVQQAAATGLALPSGKSFYVTVRAVNDAGLGTDVSSDGVVVDVTPPVVGTVSDGDQGTDVDVQASTTALSARWSGFHDPESGIAGYEWSIGTAPLASDVQAFTPLGLQLSTQQGGLSLQSGRTYFVNVRAKNRAGLASTGHSDGVRVDVSYTGGEPAADAGVALAGGAAAESDVGVPVSPGGCGCRAGSASTPRVGGLVLGSLALVHSCRRRRRALRKEGP